MKKIRNLCIAIIALVGLSSSAFAQSGQAPYVGSNHPYSVVNDDNNTYEWFVTKAYGDLASNTDAGVATLSATTGSAIDITWGSAVVGTTYFVHVIETITATGCSNHKVMAVTPINGFNLAIAAVSPTDVVLDGTAGKELEDCAPNVIVSGYDTDSGEFTYNYGENTFYYKITASGIGENGWSPQLTIDAGAAESYTAQWATEIGGTYTGNDLTVDGAINDIIVAGTPIVAPAVNASIWVKVTVDNAEGLADNLITVTLLDDAGTSEDEFGNDVSTIAVTKDISTQTVKFRPTVNGITTN